MGRPRKITDADIEEMKRLDDAGLIRVAIAERFSIDQSLVTKLLGKRPKDEKPSRASS